ncbi:MAG: hypothetical protein BJBARM4_0805 [Candidatus Parvarchaeum acidiphilum ARMAN-4]|jgi:hypothetical protein|uniref:Uncharacterized protein n=1 Tax=Candidatus Parvarchaeum acidiphilum ARMAN-4 TaxID=662760 RepID=D2EGA5_PARA4|nr:hypothetical protein [Candidatus Parvarchaeum acidiphilum ARMAN-4]EEZ92608.1 MAG: hypothetical protein BJBARM4_0805 [Candidatus Parvarchaeum acidiphilum ARMAN-4]
MDSRQELDTAIYKRAYETSMYIATKGLGKEISYPDLYMGLISLFKGLGLDVVKTTLSENNIEINQYTIKRNVPGVLDACITLRLHIGEDQIKLVLTSFGSTADKNFTPHETETITRMAKEMIYVEDTLKNSFDLRMENNTFTFERQC